MKVLFIIDMQKDFIDGALANEQAQKIVPRIAKCAENYSNIVLTRDTHYSNYLETQEGRKLPVPHCIKDTEGWQVDEDIMKAVEKKNIAFIDKPNFGATENAINTALFKDLLIRQDAKIDSIDIVGTCTDICVVSNALTLKHMFPEVEVNIFANLCAGLTEASHIEALHTMKNCQCNINLWTGDIDD